jgi:hypothetical protein
VSQPDTAEKSEAALPELAAKRRQNRAHGASRGLKVATGQAPEERKNGCDTGSGVLAPQRETQGQKSDSPSLLVRRARTPVLHYFSRKSTTSAMLWLRATARVLPSVDQLNLEIPSDVKFVI